MGAGNDLFRVLTRVERAPTPPAEEPTTTRSSWLMSDFKESSAMTFTFVAIQCQPVMGTMLSRCQFVMTAPLYHLFQRSATVPGSPNYVLRLHVHAAQRLAPRVACWIYARVRS